MSPKRKTAIKGSRKKIGLALGGGASKGLAHIGVLKALEDAEIPIDFIAGTSMGAIVGGWYALDGDIEAMERVVSGLKKREKKLLVEIIRRKGRPLLRDETLLEMVGNYFGGKKISDCKIPFRAVATDIKDGNQVVISKGSIKDAVMASSAIPVVFDPVEADGKVLIDGGFVNPVPADVVREMGADIVIAVDVSNYWFDVSAFPAGSLNLRNLQSIFHAMVSVLGYQLSKEILKKADMVIRPPVLGYRWFDFREAEDIISAGYRTARASMADICRITECRLPEKGLFEKFWDFVFGLE